MTQPATVIGFVDGAADGEIFGWAMDRSCCDGAVFLNISVAGRPVMRIATFESRPDVAVAFGNQGMNGFRFQLPAEVLNEPLLAISIQSDEGDHLTNSPLRVARDVLLPGPARGHCGKEPCVLFMHIPRTSGTAFRKAIEPNYPASERLCYYPGPPGIWYERFETLPARQLASFNFIAGHFVFGIHSYIDRSCEYITIIRDPIARVISNYWFAVRNKPGEITSNNGHVFTLEEVLERHMLAELDNLTVRCFGGYGEREARAGALGPEAYDAAVDNAQRFRFIGHQDRSEEAWNCLRRIFGWQRGALEHLNAGHPEDHEVSVRTRTAIEHYCRYDIAFYKDVLLRQEC